MMTSKPLDKGELRQDLVTGKWVAIATGRALRPDNFAKDKEPIKKPLGRYKNDCPFCNFAKFPQEKDVLRLPDDPDHWQLHIFPNKYPAFLPQDEIKSWQHGLYRAMEAAGYHEILATRLHDHIEARMTLSEMALQFEALELRYRQLKSKPSVNYIQIIKNHGAAAGGSLEHPHHQIFTTPVFPDDVADSLHGAEAYAARHGGVSPYDAMIKYEENCGERTVYQNEEFFAFCPFASRIPYAVKVLPRKNMPFFEGLGPNIREALADAILNVLGRLYTGLNNPPYNYYIHSAPCDETGFVCDTSMFQHFRWHIDIMPRLTTWGGFELGTGLEINTVSPETAATFLREQVAPQSL